MTTPPPQHTCTKGGDNSTLPTYPYTFTVTTTLQDSQPTTLTVPVTTSVDAITTTLPDGEVWTLTVPLPTPTTQVVGGPTPTPTPPPENPTDNAPTPTQTPDPTPTTTQDGGVSTEPPPEKRRSFQIRGSGPMGAKLFLRKEGGDNVPTPTPSPTPVPLHVRSPPWSSWFWPSS